MADDRLTAGPAGWMLDFEHDTDDEEDTRAILATTTAAATTTTTTTAKRTKRRAAGERLTRSLSPVKRGARRALDLPASNAERIRRAVRQELESLDGDNILNKGPSEPQVFLVADAGEGAIDDDTLERASHIDLRLEKAYRKKVRQRRRRQPLSRLDPLPGRLRASTLEADADDDREDTMGLLDDLAQGSAGMLQSSISTSTATLAPDSMVDGWLRDLAERDSDPVSIGKKCIEVWGMEFDACLRFLREDLAFLQTFTTAEPCETCSVASGSVFAASSRGMMASVDGVPRQITDTCLQRGSKLLRLWRAEHRILYFLLERYSDERARFALESDPSFAAALEQKNSMLRKDVEARDEQIAELQQALGNCNEILDALAAYSDAANDDEDFRLLRKEISALRPSGVTEALSRLLEHMRRITGARRQRLALSWSDEVRREDSVEKQPSRARSESSGPAGAPEASADEAEEAGSLDEDVMLPAEAPEPERNEFGKVVVVGAADKRRASVCIQDNIEHNVKLLDDIQQSRFMASWLTNVEQTHLKSLIMELDEAGQRSLVASLLESAADGRATNFIREILRQLNSSRDRVDLILEFVQMLDADELDMIAPTLVKNVTSKRLLDSMRHLDTVVSEGEGSDGAGTTPEVSEAPVHFDDDESELLSKHVQTDLSIPMYDHPDEAKHFIMQAIKDEIENGRPHSPLSTFTQDDEGEVMDVDEVDASGSSAEDVARETQSPNVVEDELKDGSDEDGPDEDAEDDEDGENEDEGASRPSSGSTTRSQKRRHPRKKLKKVATTFNTVDIRNKSLLREGGELAVMVTLRRIYAKFITPLLHEALPWEKYLHRPPKHRRARKIEASHLQDVIIGEVYQKKVQSDKMLREAGRKTHSLAKTILHFFTQKYGLKKLAEEYLYGIVQAIREDNAQSHRIKLFGMLVGVVDPEHYSQTLCDVVMSVLAAIFPRHDCIAKAMEHGTARTVVQSTYVIKAVRSIFRLVDGDVNRSGAADNDEGDEVSPDSQRYWVMPSAFRQRLLKWVETHSVPESEVDKSTTSDIKVVNCDQFLAKVAQVFLSKVELDRTMTMQLFRTFDVNGDGVLSFDEFQELLRTAQPQPPLNETQVMDLWIEVNDHEDDDDDDIITAEAFATICIRRNIELPYWKYDNENVMVRLVKQLEESI